MNKFKNTIIIMLGAISTFFYALLHSKNQKLKKQQNEIQKINKDNDSLKEVISGVERDAKRLQEIKKDIRSKSIDAVIDELRQRGEYKD